MISRAVSFDKYEFHGAVLGPGAPLVAPLDVAQFLVNGVVFGAILGVSAIGLSLVYGILRLANFAHGEFLTMGALFAYLFAVLQPTWLGPLALGLGAALALLLAVDVAATRRLERGERLAIGGFALALGIVGVWTLAETVAVGTTLPRLLAATLVAAACAALLAGGLDVALWRPLRRRHATLLTLVIVSIGLALVMRNALQLGFGAENLAFARGVPVSELLFGVRVSDAQQFAFPASLAIMGALHAFLTRTRTGKAMRALADNPDLARACGVPVDRVILHVWVLGAALTASAGVLLTLVQNNTMNVAMGSGLLLPLFAAVILGGIGSAHGAIAGGFVVGIGMKTSVLWLGAEYELASAFLLLLAVLLVRPQGLFRGA